MAASVSMPLGGVQVGSYDTYEQAQAAVDYLSDQKFAVENVTIIGSDLRMVERVTGRLSWGRAVGVGMLATSCFTVGAGCISATSCGFAAGAGTVASSAGARRAKRAGGAPIE